MASIVIPGKKTGLIYTIMHCLKKGIMPVFILAAVFLSGDRSPLFSNIVIDKSLKEKVIGLDLEYLCDNGGLLSLSDVMSSGLRQKWLKSRTETRAFGKNG